MEMIKTFLQSSTITVLNSVRGMHMQGHLYMCGEGGLGVRTGVLQHIGTREDCQGERGYRQSLRKMS